MQLMQEMEQIPCTVYQRNPSDSIIWGIKATCSRNVAI